MTNNDINRFQQLLCYGYGCLKVATIAKTIIFEVLRCHCQRKLCSFLQKYLQFFYTLKILLKSVETSKIWFRHQGVLHIISIFSLAETNFRLVFHSLLSTVSD